ncbi:hypothetical protein [Halogeometricum sp. CBA1124]|uniref:hypothetical protein n=1 Tax=Halogeometricum sp. CBA1124 TaxID=2668071 RepID=UPI0014297447|nr:hypothetical protein [Halogeometricum sp. CBA1124]MUV56098.1 hypothetical protein [Halogeometricum sp. CBA1124]
MNQHPDYADQIQDELEDLGIEADFTGLEINPPTDQEPDVKSEETVKIVGRHPEQVTRQNLVHNFLTSDGNQISVTIRERPQCPTCDYILAGEDERPFPSLCNERVNGKQCQRWTCPQCEGICAGCGKILCTEHVTGHGVKDETYCYECGSDVDEKLRHERTLEREDQEHTHRIDEWDRQIKQTRMEREQEREDWKAKRDLLKIILKTLVEKKKVENGYYEGDRRKRGGREPRIPGNSSDKGLFEKIEDRHG